MPKSVGLSWGKFRICYSSAESTEIEVTLYNKDKTRQRWQRGNSLNGLGCAFPAQIKNPLTAAGSKCGVQKGLESADTVGKQKEDWQNRTDPRTPAKTLEGAASQSAALLTARYSAAPKPGEPGAPES